MKESLDFLFAHGYTVVFFWVLAEQLGLPLPSIPILLAAGALSALGQLSLLLVLSLGIAAAMISDVVWYVLGRHRGMKVLEFLCRISLEPDSCVRRTEGVFERYGARSLVIAKFIPGFNTIAPPLAGVIGMKWPQFLLFDSLGSAVWVGGFVGIGYIFSMELERAAAYAARLGASLTVILAGGLIAYIVAKYFARRKFVRDLRIARITPEELRQKMLAGEDIAIVDLRHSLDFEAAPYMIPGAIRLEVAEMEGRHQEIPRDREVVLYCT